MEYAARDDRRLETLYNRLQLLFHDAKNLDPDDAGREANRLAFTDRALAVADVYDAYSEKMLVGKLWRAALRLFLSVVPRNAPDQQPYRAATAQGRYSTRSGTGGYA